MATKDPFEEIAENAIAQAEQVVCSFDDFIGGLALIRDLITDRLDMARDEDEDDDG